MGHLPGDRRAQGAKRLNPEARRVRRELALLFATLFFVMVGFGIVIPTLPYFARELGANSFQMGLIITLWAVAQFAVAPLWGNLSDRIGRRPVILWGMCGYALCFVAMASAHSLWTLYAARFFGGMLSAATIPAVQAYVADTTPAGERGPRLALMGAARNMGSLCGPSVGALLVPLGLRTTFEVSAVLAGANLLAVLLLLREPETRLAGDGNGRRGVSGPQAVPVALASPNRLLYILSFVATFGGSSMFALLPYLLIDRLGAPPLYVAIAFTIDGGVSACTQMLLIRALHRRYGEQRTLRIGLVSGCLGLLGLATLWWYIPLLVMLCGVSIGVSLLRPTIASLLSQRTEFGQGVTMGMQMSFDALGRTVGPLWAGWTYLFATGAPFFSASLLWVTALAVAAWPALAGRRAQLRAGAR